MEAHILTSPKQHKLVDLNSAQEVPDSHVWKSIDDDDITVGGTLLASESLPPVIDLSEPNAMELVGDACKKWGMFQITNHGVPSELIDEMERAAVSLFDLPLEKKLEAARVPGMFPGYGNTIYSHIFPKQLWIEGFNIFGSPLEHAKKLWPDDYNKFCDLVAKYQEEMKKLTNTLMRLLLGSLGIDKEEIEWANPYTEQPNKSPPGGLQLNFYPSCPDPSQTLGLMAHTDSIFLNILYQNQVSGLQIRPENGGWITIPPVPNAFVINVGDMFQVFSNGLYPSVLHRVVVNQDKDRLSVVYFYVASGNMDVSPHPKLVDSTHPALYRSVNWTDYRVTKGKLFNKALATLRVDYKEE